MIALAGRRIDAPDARPARFPLARVHAVRDALAALFRQERATALVSSAACGADLLALDVARELGVPGRIVLPFPPERFRETSVVDRPGEWGRYFDEAVARAREEGDLRVLPTAGEGSAAYAAANEAILAEAEGLASDTGDALTAVLVWEGHSRGPDDLTEAFGALARARHMRVVEVLTLDSSD